MQRVLLVGKLRSAKSEAQTTNSLFRASRQTFVILVAKSMSSITEQLKKLQEEEPLLMPNKSDNAKDAADFSTFKDLILSLQHNVFSKLFVKKPHVEFLGDWSERWSNMNSPMIALRYIGPFEF